MERSGNRATLSGILRCAKVARAEEARRVPLGALLPGMQEALRGGLPVGCITEVVGPSGAGKTQLCIGALLAAAAPRPWGLHVRPLPALRALQTEPCASLLRSSCTAQTRSLGSLC